MSAEKIKALSRVRKLEIAGALTDGGIDHIPLLIILCHRLTSVHLTLLLLSIQSDNMDSSAMRRRRGLSRASISFKNVMSALPALNRMRKRAKLVSIPEDLILEIASYLSRKDQLHLGMSVRFVIFARGIKT